MILGPHGASSNELGEPIASDHHRPARAREVEAKRSMDKAPLPKRIHSRRGIKAESAMEDLKKEAAMSERTMVKEDETIVNSHVVNDPADPEIRPASALTLHDLERDGRFSQECKEILANTDLKRAWLLPPAQGRPLRSLTFKHNQSGQQTSRLTHVQPGTAQQEPGAADIIGLTPDQKSNQPVPKITMTTMATAADKTISEPAPQARPSSKGRAPRATIVQTTQLTDGESNAIPRRPSSTKPTSIEPSVRLPSYTSMGDQAPKILRPRASTDTLTRIEVQVQAHPSAAAAEKLKEETAIIIPGSTKAGPRSVPPDRPLPALPADSMVRRRPSLKKNRRDRPTTLSSGNCRAGPWARTVRVVASFPEPPSVPGSKERSIDQTVPWHVRVAAAKGLSVEPTASSKDGPQPSLPDSQTPTSSPCSQASIKLAGRTFARHTIPGPRADKVVDKRKRDLATDRAARRVGSEDGGRHSDPAAPESAPPATPLPPQSPRDELDQFPSVPSSRPPSRASGPTGQCHSRTHSYMYDVRHSFRASPIHHRPRTSPRQPVQILGQSNIFVVVDTDPVTARFRAGAMSPAPSMKGGASSRGGSPLKSLQLSSAPTPPEIVRDRAMGRQALRQKVNHRNFENQSTQRTAGQAGSKRSKRAAKSRNNSGENRSSSDDSGPPPMDSSSSHTKSTRAQKRRRWNSNDINLIRTLQRDLEEYYRTILKQEEKIRWQADQIQMMIKVIMPMNRTGGITFPPSAGFTNVVESPSIDVPLARRTLEAAPDAGHAHKKETTTSAPPAHHRPASHLSTASETTNASTADLSDKSAEASMTDPFEDDLIPRPPTTMAAPTGAVEPKPVSRGHVWSSSLSANAAVWAVRLHQPPPVARAV